MQLFYLGQMVTSDFSGLERQMYKLHNQDIKCIDHFLEKDDIGIILEIAYDTDGRNCWLKLLTNDGVIGHVPSIWMRSV